MALLPSDSVLRHPAFAWYWVARAATMMAYQMLSVAVGWQVYEITRSAFELGMIGLVQFVPSIALMLVVGHVADRYDRRAIARSTMIVGGAATLVLAVASFTGRVDELLIFGAVFVIGTARAFQNPAVQALLPALVPPQHLSRAVASSASAAQIAVVSGPALGGLLYAFGPAAVYATVVVLYAVGAYSMHRARYDHVPGRKEPPSLAALLIGIEFIRKHPAMLGAISLDLFAVLLGGATALLPVYASDVLAVGPLGLGVLRSAPAIGALLVAVWLARHPLGSGVGRKMMIAVTVWGAATVVFGLSTLFPLSLAALAVMGAADMVSMVIRQSLIQMGTPDEMRGRVSAVNTMFVGASNQLGEFESGVTAAWFGAVPAVVLGGIGTLAVVALWTRLFPTLARYDRIEPVT